MGAGGLQISSDEGGGGVSLGLNFFYSGIFLGRKIWQV